MQINIGAEEYVIPSIAGCLSEGLGKFHTTQNAILVHEWLRGTSLTPPVLKSKIDFSDKRQEERVLGYKDHAFYPERWYPGQLLRLEKTMLALPAISDMMVKQVNKLTAKAPGTDLEGSSKLIQQLANKLYVVECFNASALYFDHQIPKRLCLETMSALDVLITMVINQRKQCLYEHKEMTKVPLSLYAEAELDKVIGVIHKGSLEGFFPNPAMVQSNYNFLNVDFFHQCAMAFSSTSTVMIPHSYIQPVQTDVYAWAYAVLTSMKNTVPDFRTKTKLSVISSI